MERITIPHKLVFHVPLKAWVDGFMVDIPAHSRMEEFIDDLAGIGITSLYYIENCVGVYNDRTYPEALITLFCDADHAPTAVVLFEAWAAKNNDDLKQEAYAYEKDGEMTVIRP